MQERLNCEFDQLWASYRDTAGEVAASDNFLAGVWRKIEAARPRSPQQELERLFAAARAQSDEIEPSADYMPALWSKIEAARPQEGWLGWACSWAPRLAGAGALAAAILTFAVWSRPSVDSVVLEAGYMDHLARASMDEHDAALWTLAGLRP